MASAGHGKQVLARCLHMAFDAEKYSARTTLAQRDLQQRIFDVVVRATASIGLAPKDYALQPQGDGGLLRLPAGIDEAVAVSGLIREMRAELATVNRELIAEARVRMRLGFLSGLSQDAALGFAGDAPVSVSRLINSPALRARLKKAEHSALAVILPDALFQELVAQRLRGLDPDEWEPVRVVEAAKNYACDAWMSIPGRPPAPAPDEAGADQRRPDAPPVRPSDASVQSIGTLSVINGPVTVERGGFHIGR